MHDTVVSPEKAEEVKLKARYPHLGAKPGGSDLLRKRLQKGVSGQVHVMSSESSQWRWCIPVLMFAALLFCAPAAEVL